MLQHFREMKLCQWHINTRDNQQCIKKAVDMGIQLYILAGIELTCTIGICMLLYWQKYQLNFSERAL
jgi:hypothetical protein